MLTELERWKEVALKNWETCYSHFTVRPHCKKFATQQIKCGANTYCDDCVKIFIDREENCPCDFKELLGADLVRNMKDRENFKEKAIWNGKEIELEFKYDYNSEEGSQKHISYIKDIKIIHTPTEMYPWYSSCFKLDKYREIKCGSSSLSATLRDTENELKRIYLLIGENLN